MMLNVHCQILPCSANTKYEYLINIYKANNIMIDQRHYKGEMPISGFINRSYIIRRLCMEPKPADLRIQKHKGLA